MLWSLSYNITLLAIRASILFVLPIRGSAKSKAGPNDQVHRAGGPTRGNVAKPINVNEGNDVEKPKREPAPVRRLPARTLDN